jgi:hypothetical protein
MAHQQDWKTTFADFVRAASALFREGRVPVRVQVWYSDGFEWMANLSSASDPSEWDRVLSQSLRPALAHSRHKHRRPVVAGVWFSDHSSIQFGFPSPRSLAEEGEVLSHCKQDLKNLLREANQRMVTNSILQAFQARGIVWGESTVKRALAEMVMLSELTNRQDVRPRGYGLPEWE